MVKCILVVWFVANFVIAGLASVIAHQWYVGWAIPSISKMWVELVLLMLPNLILPIVVLRYRWCRTVGPLKTELGWVLRGWKSVLTGIMMFGLLYGAMKLVGAFLGESIPYNLPGSQDAISAQNPLVVIELLVSLVVFVVVTVVSEETMFRGLVQTQIGKRYGGWVGIVVAAALFGLRHLPNDIYYAHVWRATPQMWLSRELHLYLTALILGITRHVGRSTYASTVTHGLLLVTVLFGF